MLIGKFRLRAFLNGYRIMHLKRDMSYRCFFLHCPICTYLLLELLLKVENRNIKNTFLLASKIQKHKDRGGIFHDFQGTLYVKLKWYFVTKIVLTYCEKKYSSDQEIFLKFEAEGREFFCKNFEITRTICSNSERSDSIGKKYWDLETCRKS